MKFIPFRLTLMTAAVAFTVAGLSAFQGPPVPSHKLPASTPQKYNLVWYGVDFNARTYTEDNGARTRSCGAWYKLNPNHPDDVPPGYAGQGGAWRTATPLLESARPEGCDTTLNQSDDPNEDPWNSANPPFFPYLSSDPAVIRQHAYWFAAMGVNGVIIDWTNMPCSSSTLGASAYYARLRDATRAVMAEFDHQTADHPPLKVVIAMRKWEAIPAQAYSQAQADFDTQCVANDAYAAYNTYPAATLALNNSRPGGGTNKPLMIMFPAFQLSNAWKTAPQWSDALSRFDMRFTNGYLLQNGFAQTTAGAACETSLASVCKAINDLPYWAFIEWVRDPAPGRGDYYQTLVSQYTAGSVNTEQGTALVAIHQDTPLRHTWDGIAQNTFGRSIEPFYSLSPQPQVLTLNSFNYPVGNDLEPQEGLSLNTAFMLEPSVDFGYNLFNQATMYVARARNLTTERTGTPAIWGWSGNNVLLTLSGWPLEYRVSQSSPNESAAWQMVRPNGGTFALPAGTTGAWYVQTRNSFGASAWINVNNTSATPLTLADVVAQPESFNGNWPGFSFGLTGDIPFIVQLDPANAPVPAVYRPSNQHWYFKLSTGTKDIQWGLSGDIPQIVRLDAFDHVAVYRPGTGQVYVNLDNETYSGSNLLTIGGWHPPIPANVSATVSSAVVGSTNSFTGTWNGFSFGLAGDRPLLIQLMPGGPKLPVVFRPETAPLGGAHWHIQQGGYSDFSLLHDKVIAWGLAADKPRIVVWTDGKEHLAVCRSGTVLVNTNNESWNGSNVATYGGC